MAYALANVWHVNSALFFSICANIFPAFLPPSLPCPSAASFEFICRLSKMFTRSWLLKAAALHSAPPQAPHCPLPNCFHGFLGAKFMQDMPEIHEKAEKKRRRWGRGCSVFKCSSCAGNAGQVACGSRAGMLHFQDAGDGDGGLSIEIMALPVQEKW